jgi:hypothetical protein
MFLPTCEGRAQHCSLRTNEPAKMDDAVELNEELLEGILAGKWSLGTFTGSLHCWVACLRNITVRKSAESRYPSEGAGRRETHPPRDLAVPRRFGWQSRRIFGVHVVGVLPYRFAVSLGAAPTRFVSGMVARFGIDDLWGLGDLMHKTVSCRTCPVLIQRLHN